MSSQSSRPAPRSATIVCLDVVETLVLHRDVFEELRVKHPAVEGVLTHALVAEVRRVSSLLIEALYLPVDCRVWRRVAELAVLYGPPVEGAVLIPLTQDDVAHLAGTTRPSANKVLRAGEERGVLRIGRARIEVLDVDAATSRCSRSCRRSLLPRRSATAMWAASGSWR